MSNVIIILTILAAALSMAVFVVACMQSPTREQKLLLMMAAALLVQAIGCSLCIMSPWPEGAMMARILSHFGGVHIPLCFVLFFGSISRVKLSKPFTLGLFFGNLIILSLLSTNGYHGLAFTKMEYYKIGNAMVGDIEYGPFYNIYLIWNFAYILIVIYMILKGRRMGNFKYKKIRIGMICCVICAFTAYFPYALEAVFKCPYDLRSITCTIAAGLLLYTIYHFGIYSVNSDFGNAVAEELDDAIIAYRNDKTLVAMNKTAKSICKEINNVSFGLSVEEGGETLKKLLALEEDDVIKIDDRIFTCTIKPVMNQKNERVGSIHWLRDVTKEDATMAETMRLKDEADRANEAKSLFLAHMSHEIRTPINAIIGMDELIIRETGEEGTTERAKDVMRAAKTLLSLINDILDFSKIEAGKMEIVASDYSLASVLKELQIMIKFRAEKKKLDLIFNVDERLPKTLKGDEVRIKQVITNVLTNAVKYTEKGSITVHVHFENRDDGRINLLVDVTDTGIGIKKEDLPKLYGSFERIENDSVHKTEGTGLGMSITTKLLALMEGMITVESEYGKGSTFHIIVPQEVVDVDGIGDFTKAIDEAIDKQEAERILFEAPEATVLIVDDNKVNRVVARSLLKDTKIKFEEADSGKQALEMIKEKRYDIILMDHRMPEMSGIETFEAMQQGGHLNEGVPVIALTADAESGAREFYKSKGFAEYLVKPIDPILYEKLILMFLDKEKVKYL